MPLMGWACEFPWEVRVGEAATLLESAACRVLEGASLPGAVGIPESTGKVRTERAAGGRDPSSSCLGSATYFLESAYLGSP